MRKSHFLTITLFLTAAALSYGGPVDLITVNTSSLAGDMGSIDFEFNPGLAALGATVQIFDFTGATYIAGTQVDTGSASGGPVPAIITLNNTFADNDDFEAVTFGTTLSFEVEFSGPAITAPNGNPSNESTFALSAFTDEAGTMPAGSLTADPNGIVAEITVNPEGALIADAVSPEATITAVPEPGAGWFVCGGLLVLGGRWLRLARKRS